MNLFPKIKPSKTIILTIILIVFVALLLVLFNGIKLFIYADNSVFSIKEDDFLLYISTPGILGLFLGILFVSSQKSWDINNCVFRIENRLEVLKLKVLLDEQVRLRGWPPLYNKENLSSEKDR